MLRERTVGSVDGGQAVPHPAESVPGWKWFGNRGKCTASSHASSTPRILGKKPANCSVGPFCGGLAALFILMSTPAGAGGLDTAGQPATMHGFRFADIDEKSLGLWEGQKPVLVYNHGVIARENVPADRARSCYVHPLYGLDGEVLTDDFPRDHYHHRGLFWAWPHINIGGTEYSLWDLRGIRHRFERWIEKQTEPDRATLTVENGWYVGTEKIVRETVKFIVYGGRGDSRAIDTEFVWIPIKGPLTLMGAEGKSYGGLTLRFAPGTNTTITIPSGVTSQDLVMTNLPWADLTRLWTSEKITSGAAIFVHPSHPDYPPQWLTRHYGVLCLGWPGGKPATFQAGETIRCRYRVWIHRGPASVERLRRAYGAYEKSP
ncbi:MAG: PmoA family protein [Verrucomicrobiae bacterium]|nr:PmoA family protein [Verrucomicrobiae bacterium]